MICTTKNFNEATAITHAGIFHGDEVMATAILSHLQENVTVYRAFKVPEGLNDDVVVYDIGGGKFDHHQKGGNGVRENGIPYSSAGLLWREFGPTIVKDTVDPEFIWNLIDSDLIQGIDAADNGAIPDTDIKVMSVSKIISTFNPSWNSSKNSDECFLEAVAFANMVFDKVLESAIAKADARSIVEKAIDMSEEHIMILDKFAPWQEFVFNSCNKKADNIWFVVFPSNRGGYNWQCVTTGLGCFSQRKPVPESWRGLQSKDLQTITGVKTAMFCHPAGFIGGAETLKDTLTMAKLAINA